MYTKSMFSRLFPGNMGPAPPQNSPCCNSEMSSAGFLCTGAPELQLHLCCYCKSRFWQHSPEPWLTLPVTIKQITIEKKLPPACGKSMSYFYCKWFCFWMSCSCRLCLWSPNAGGLWQPSIHQYMSSSVLYAKTCLQVTLNIKLLVETVQIPTLDSAECT